MIKLKYILIGFPIIAACSKTEPVSVPDTVAVVARIVNGKYDDTKATVVANAYTESVPSEKNPLEADIWFSTTKDTYLGTAYGTKGVSEDGLCVDAHRTITYMSPSITNPNLTGDQKVIKYPSGKDLHCVGLYPRNAWQVTTPDGKHAYASIDGSQDLMYAPQLTGNQSVPLSAGTQKFSHELCWLKIRLRSQDLTAGETWGKVQKIEVASLSTANVDFSNDAVTFSGDTTMLCACDTLAAMPIMSTEFSSIFVSPTCGTETVKARYKVKVTCEHNTKVAYVELTDEKGDNYIGNTAGKVFVLTLFFKPLSTMEFTASLTNWDDEARVVTLK